MMPSFVAPLLAGVASLAFAFFAFCRLLSYLHIFQQDEYDNRRFLRWLFSATAFDRRLSLALLVIGIAALVEPLGTLTGPVALLLASVAMAVVAATEADPRQVAKKKLAMTARARRIFILALLLAVLVGVPCIAFLPPLAWIIAVQLVPLGLVGGNLLLVPFERRVQLRYWREAHDKLAALHPTVVAVTGSYGKTSVKHILGHILAMSAPTLITPGSVNTPMGVARIVRERLDARHRFFVVEMGAYGIGSIARLCRLVPPRFGIVTAIGKAHYERFKSLDTVARTKFELGEAVAATGGRLVVWDDTLSYPATADFARRHPTTLVPCGVTAGELVLQSNRATPEGVCVELLWHGVPYQLTAPLHGAHHGRNMALAFAAACTLGLAPEDVQLALRSTPQIAHRLEVKRQPNGALLIDDAYNSNPEGFSAALAVLDGLRRPGGRRILVTPGMVELGTAHEEEHRLLGAQAGRTVDVLLAVAPARIASFTAAYRAASPGGQIIECAGFAEAQSWLAANLMAADVALLENDLPDLFERRLRL
jgi:UDP-N-acetylmuramoyl-tripeptide--D-alanyl-D-alanine ligase